MVDTKVVTRQGRLDHNSKGRKAATGRRAGYRGGLLYDAINKYNRLSLATVI